MDYIRLVDIRNQYPNLPSYVRKDEKLVNLFGLYKETNKLNFKLPSIEHIKPIDDLNLRLVFGFRKNIQDKDIKYYTSQQFYSDMEASNIEGNPYFYLQSNKVEFIVLVNLEKFISIFEGLKEVENKQGINVNLNNFLNLDNSIDYTKLMRFLNWVLSKSELDEIDTDGVIPADKLAEWKVGDYDPIMMKWTFNSNKDTKSGNSSFGKEYKIIKISNLRNAILGNKRFVYKNNPLKNESFEIIEEIFEGSTFYGQVEGQNGLSTIYQIFDSTNKIKGYATFYQNDELIEIKENTSQSATNQNNSTEQTSYNTNTAPSNLSRRERRQEKREERKERRQEKREERKERRQERREQRRGR